MTRASWDLLSILLYGRPGQKLPPYVARRAGELDTYLRYIRLQADSPIVIAHAEGILAVYRMETHNAEQWTAVQKALDNISGRLERIERRLWPPKPTPAIAPKTPSLWQRICNFFSDN